MGEGLLLFSQNCSCSTIIVPYRRDVWWVDDSNVCVSAEQHLNQRLLDLGPLSRESRHARISHSGDSGHLSRGVEC